MKKPKNFAKKHAEAIARIAKEEEIELMHFFGLAKKMKKPKKLCLKTGT